jgi:hypothetical protein
VSEDDFCGLLGYIIYRAFYVYSVNSEISVNRGKEPNLPLQFWFLPMKNRTGNRNLRFRYFWFGFWYFQFGFQFSVFFCPGLRTGVGIAAMPGGGLRARLLLRQVTLYHPPLFLSILFLRELELCIIFIRIKSTLKT